MRMSWFIVQFLQLRHFPHMGNYHTIQSNDPINRLEYSGLATNWTFRKTHRLCTGQIVNYIVNKNPFM